MTWHLKDRELEKKLIAIDTDFIERLNQNCEIWDSNHDGDLLSLSTSSRFLDTKTNCLVTYFLQVISLKTSLTITQADGIIGQKRSRKSAC